MVALAATLREFLCNAIDLDNDTSRLEKANAIIDEGINPMDELIEINVTME